MSLRLIKALNQIKELPVVTVGSVAEHVQEEGAVIVCLIAILPFMQPIPIPGLSSILGLIVLLQGVGLMLWSRPMLTKKMKRVIISKEKFEMIYKVALKFSHLTSKLSTFNHPLINTRPGHMVCGLSIIVSSAFLSLPLPIPFTNLIPAISIFLTCIGLLEEDILLVFLGLGTTATVVGMAIFSYQLIIDHVPNWI